MNGNGASSSHSSFSIVKVGFLAAGIGIIGGVAAEGLHRLIGLVTNLVFYQRFGTHIESPLESPLGVGIIFVPAIGGLIIGLMAKYGTPLVRGHGIPEAMEAILLKRSKIPPRVALLKPLSAAISIGSGGPFGAEGPIIQTGGALGSLLGQAVHMTVAERKVLLACGAAAGLSATFGTPVAAVIFAIELLLFEFRTRSFIPLVIASTIAAEMHIVFIGPEPVFAVPAGEFGDPLNLLFFLVLGLLCGGTAIVLTRSLHWVEDGFHRLPINHYLFPAVGGLFVGVVGYAVPHLTYHDVDVFGPGYAVIENTVTGQYAFGFLLVLLLSKTAVWLVALGSGTSGGTLAPIFMIGAALGATFGVTLKKAFPDLDVSTTSFALAGMAAVFGGSTRATFASIVFAFEMTHDYESLLPIMFTCVIADLIATRFMETSLLTEQLRRGGVLVHHEYEADLLGMVKVAATMETRLVTVPASMTVRELADRIHQHDPELTRHQGLPILNVEGELVGIITRSDMRLALQEGYGDMSVLEAGTHPVVTITPNASLHDAILRMFQYDIGRLPVVEDEGSNRLVGYLSRTHVIRPYLQRLHDEQNLEAGWMQAYFEHWARIPRHELRK
ncbi:MAG: chloride channel protein [Chloroflexota bacterium]|nr:CBS domain-containing protein [Chloroflexota bacterium]NOG64065.1 chloride channel protein [Chloroflexota bacterium]GIK65631.1 MAG: chloride channel protein [Chloroflexota bacterium]